MRILVLSPHPDDAVWSLGGWLARQRQDGHTVTVMTVFDGDPDTVPPQGDAWRQASLTALRRREDALALDQLGARRLSLGLVDAALRTDADGRFLYATPSALFAPLPDDLGAARDRVAAGLAATGPWDLLIAPAGFGGHVDHISVRDVVAGAATAGQTYWYGEFPYARTGLPLAASARLEVSVDWPIWRDAARLYHSQVRRLFRTTAAFEASLADHCGATGANARVVLYSSTAAA